MAFKPEEYPSGTPSILKDDSQTGEWTPIIHHACSFPPEIFYQVMMNLIRNPNINSSHLFRADILFEAPFIPDMSTGEFPPQICHVDGFDLKTVLVRRLIPRKPQVDNPLDQTCLLFSKAHDSNTKSLVIYIPHVSAPSETPFYHPNVKGVAFLHEFDSSTSKGLISLHYKYFTCLDNPPNLQRTAQHLLAAIHKHGESRVLGDYVKKGRHDTLLPQAVVQNTYSRIKAKYAKTLIESWAEVTDPTKHVFEDLNIAAFLIELWNEMYPAAEGVEFPGFVDIGCGNGLLVHLLIEEGYKGWGFDARRRKSWAIYPPHVQENLKELVLVPSILNDDIQVSQHETTKIQPGFFDNEAFIISNHADELTPWTPILAALSSSPFLMIPCCSHNLTGARFRAPPPPKVSGKSESQYSSLVVWVRKIAEDCGWVVEEEMLRIPSTRNMGLVGRRRTIDVVELDMYEIIKKYGGAAGWKTNAMKLVKGAARSH